MITLINTLALVLAPHLHLHPAHELGAAVVCAEARGASEQEQRMVAAVLHNRAKGSVAALEAVARKPRQFARPCPRGAVTAQHRASFEAGWRGAGLPTWWSVDVRAFATHRAARRVEGRWLNVYGWRRVDAGEFKHRFYEGELVRHVARSGRK